MHQTFYIDADEEISSVIDRLRKSMAVDNYFVAPKRAIFLQSIVNLKLLKREAEKIKKHVILVTQEEVVAAMAARSGVDVRFSVDGSDEVLDVELKSDYLDNLDTENSGDISNPTSDKSIRLKNVGSGSFYEEDVVHRKKASIKGIVPKHTSSIDKNIHIEKTLKHRETAGSTISFPHNVESRSAIRKNSLSVESSFSGRRNNFHKLAAEKEKILEKMFSRQTDDASFENRQISSVKTKNVLFIFIFISLFLLAGVGGYLYIPSAEIIIKPNIQTIKIDADAKFGEAGKTGDFPVKIVSKQQQMTLQYEATGKNVLAGKKAHGQVVLYNEFDSQPQTLVETTRLQSENGKIFRLTETVVVPGLSNIGGELKPGAISVEITADQPGADYNIETGKFSIPGFQGSPKYEKFYAKSSVAMAGGTTEGESSKTISQADLENAKQKTQLALKDKIQTVIKGELQPEEIYLPEAEKTIFEKAFTESKAGDNVDFFDYTVTASIYALVFSQKDIENVIKGTPQFAEHVADDCSKVIGKIEYVSVEPNFESNFIAIKIHSDIELIPNINEGLLVKELLGKNESEMASVLKKHQNIKNADVVFYPNFVSRIPQFSQRVEVRIQR
ncbi:MAG: hypothetical protein HGA61_02915 [Candidatus Moranbacteria bacterium]|nr:hypothetical protein [Candidatus Moranbacteria bacterium]